MMRKHIIGLFLVGFVAQMYAQNLQVEQLNEVFIVATNYKYLDKTSAEDVAVPVKELQRTAATYNIKNLDIYQDDYDYYEISFVIPEGKILASYDKEGKILRTAEKYKKVDLPTPVLMAIAKRFPNWSITKNVYRVFYHETDGVKMKYKLTLENGDQRMKIKVDEGGNFI
jgi:hypothetical protein